MNAALAEASHYHDPGAIGYFAVRAYGSQTLHGNGGTAARSEHSARAA